MSRCWRPFRLLLVHDWKQHPRISHARLLAKDKRSSMRWTESYWESRRECQRCGKLQYTHYGKYIYEPEKEWWDVEPLPVAKLVTSSHRAEGHTCP